MRRKGEMEWVQVTSLLPRFPGILNPVGLNGDAQVRESINMHMR